MNVVVGFSRSKYLLSKIICCITNSKCSHTYIKVCFGAEDAVLVFQASGISVNVENYDVFLDNHAVVDEMSFDITEERWDKIYSFMLKQLGKPYSFKALIGMLWVLIARRFGKRVRNPFADGDHSYVCVELVAKALGIQGAEEMTPQDLLELLQAHQVEL